MTNNAAELRNMITNVNNNSAEFDNNKLTARQRINSIFVTNTFVEVGSYVGDGDNSNIDNYGAVITGYGAINGNLVFVFSQDFSRNYGALTPSQSKKTINIIRMAVKKQAPLIGVFDSAGTSIDKGLSSIETLGEAMKELILAKDSIYTIASISGPCGGLTATMASLFSFKVISKSTGTLYISPKTSLTDKELTSADSLSKNGFVDFVCDDDLSSCLKTRDICCLLSSSDSNDDPNRLFDTKILENDNYDIYEVITNLVDKNTFVEFNKDHAKTIVTGLAKINNVLTAIVATNHSIKDGKVCACGIDKAAKFIEKFSTKNIPLLTLVDVKGLNYGDKPESKGYAEILSSLVSSYVNFNAKTNGRSITVILGQAYGTPYVAFGSKALGTTMNYALDRSKIGVINPLTAIEFLGEVTDESKAEIQSKEWAETNANPIDAARLGYIDDIIVEKELRQRIAAAIMMFNV